MGIQWITSQYTYGHCFQLTAANEGLCLSPGAGWVTSAPNIMTGSLENNDLNGRKYMTAIVRKTKQASHDN